MAVGRSSQSRTITVTTTNTSTGITGSAGTFNEEDAGRAISGTGIPTGATLASVSSGTAATLSAAATATGSITATLGGDRTGDYGFAGWSPETDAESEVYSIAGGAGASDPALITDTTTGWGAKRRVRTAS